MLYGRIFNTPHNGRVIVTQGASSYAATPDEFKELWTVVPDDTVSGSTVNEDGSFTPPVVAEG